MLINNGKTYAETSSAARQLDAQLAAMPDKTSAAAKTLSAQAQATHGKATTLFQGETLRGLLLTSYGFSIFGERATQAANVCFALALALALVLRLASIAGFIHAARKSAEQPIGSRET